MIHSLEFHKFRTTFFFNYLDQLSLKFNESIYIYMLAGPEIFLGQNGKQIKEKGKK